MNQHSPIVEPWTAEELGAVVSEAFHDCNDMDGPHWPTVARKIAEAIGFRLSDAAGPRPLDIIYGRVNALGGYTDPNDPAAVAWAREHAAVLDVIEGFGGRDPAAFADRALTAAARRRGARLFSTMYGEDRQ